MAETEGGRGAAGFSGDGGLGGRAQGAREPGIQATKLLLGAWVRPAENWRGCRSGVGTRGAAAARGGGRGPGSRFSPTTASRDGMQKNKSQMSTGGTGHARFAMRKERGGPDEGGRWGFRRPRGRGLPGGFWLPPGAAYVARGAQDTSTTRARLVSGRAKFGGGCNGGDRVGMTTFGDDPGGGLAVLTGCGRERVLDSGLGGRRGSGGGGPLWCGGRGHGHGRQYGGGARERSTAQHSGTHTGGKGRGQLGGGHGGPDGGWAGPVDVLLQIDTARAGRSGEAGATGQARLPRQHHRRPPARHGRRSHPHRRGARPPTCGTKV